MALPTRIGRLRLPVLCFVVSKSAIKDGDVEKVVGEAVDAGATMVRVHEDGMPAGELLDLARKLRNVTRGKALLIVNDRVDVAVAADADGVELPEDGLPTRAARAQVGKYAVVGRSVYEADKAMQATQEGADFVTVGPIYKSSSTTAKPAGIDVIKDIAKDNRLPMIAAGGISTDNVADVINAGAAGVAVMSAIGGADDPKAATEALAQALKDAWSSRPDEVAVSA